MTSTERASLRFGCVTALVSLPLVILMGESTAYAQRTAQDIASARQLFNEGIELRDKGDSKGALEKFRVAHALGNTPRTGIELCRAHAALGQPVEAREVCLGVVRLAPLPEESQRSQEARVDAAALAEAERPKIGALRIKITGAPVGLQPTVVVDGAPVPVAALSEPRPVNPGVHIVAAKVGTGPETRATLETHEGELREIELVVAPPPRDETPAPAPLSPREDVSPAPPTKKNVVAIVSFSVAGISTIIGAVAGITAISAESDLRSRCLDKACGRSDWADLDAARTRGNVSTAFFVVAGVALGSGIVAVLTHKPARAAAVMPRAAASAVTKTKGFAIVPTIGLGGIGLDGSF